MQRRRLRKNKLKGQSRLGQVLINQLILCILAAPFLYAITVFLGAIVENAFDYTEYEKDKYMKEQNNDTPREPREKPERDEMDAGKDKAVEKAAERLSRSDYVFNLTDDERNFVVSFNAIQTAVHQCAREKGWWDDFFAFQNIIDKGVDDMPIEQQRYYRKAFSLIHDLSKIALIHSEQGEVTEGLRHGNPPDQHIPEFTSEEIEDADTIIRIMDKSKRKGSNLALALVYKARFNDTRPYKHGKLI